MIYLASQSPRRAELLRQIGVPFTQIVCDIDETPLVGEKPEIYVQRMAEQKAVAGLQMVKRQQLASMPLLASDTTVVCDGQILGKPGSDAEAHTMLTHLSGQSHQVMTAIALTDGNITRTQLVSTEVCFNDLTEQQITDYIATGEPRDKAGAYGIQGKGAVLVAAINGSYSSVVGLPLAEVAHQLSQFNIPVWQ